MSTRGCTSALVLLLMARLALSLAYSVANPLGEAPDEADHYAYAAYIGSEGRLPTGFSMTQAKHPPLYHLLAAAVAAPFTRMDTTFLRSNPDVGLTPGAPPNFFVHTTLESWPWRGGALAMHLGRLVSVLAGLGLTLAIYALGRRVFPAAPGVGLAAAAFAAFLPESLFIGASMSNDMLAALWSTLGLWAALAPTTGPRRGWPSALAAGIFMGLAFVSKASTVALWPVIALAMWLQTAERPLLRPAALARPAAAAAIGMLIATPWLLRNWQIYGDPMGTRLMLATIDRRHGPLGPADLWWLARGWFFSFWGKFGGAGHLALPWPFYAVWGGLLLAAAGGWLLWLVRDARRRAPPGFIDAGRAPDPVRPIRRFAAVHNRQVSDPQTDDLSDRPTATKPAILLVLLGAPLMAVLAIVSYSQVALGTDQGRLLFPALAPLALLLAGGLAAWLPTASVRDLLPSGRPAVGPDLGASLLRPPVSERSSEPAGGRTVASDQVVLAAVLAVLMAGIAVAALVAGIMAPFSPPAPPAAAVLAAAQSPSQSFGPALTLSGLRWAAGGSTATAPQLTLYWQTKARPTIDLRTDLRLVDHTGRLIWEWKRSPGAGRFSTDRWDVGRSTADVYQIPAGALRQAARLELGIRPFPDGPWLLPEGHPTAEPFVTLWEAGQ
ncbi:MAG TPA: hypothetical protein VGA61_22690 [Anaerolineae bacterium]